MLVYKITNTVNGKSYIGITARTLDARWSEHCERSRQGKRDSRLHVAMRKYGHAAFTREIVASAETADELRKLEQHYIRHFDTYERGYNCNLGGHGFLHFPAEIRAKIGATQRGKIVPAEVRAKMSAAKVENPCPDHLGAHLNTGADNPRAVKFVVGCPDGVIRVMTGLRAFVREHGLNMRHFKDRGHSKGYALLDRFNPAAVAA